MKNIFKSLLAAGILFLSAGCSTDQLAEKFNPSSEDALTAYFVQKNVGAEYSTTVTGNEVIQVEVYRQSNKGDLSVGLNQIVASNSTRIFSIPESVDFKDGEYKAVIDVVVFNIETFAKGVNYTATIAVGDHHDFVDMPQAMGLRSDRPTKELNTRAVSMATKYSSIVVSASLELIWEPVYILKNPGKLLEQKTNGTEEGDVYMKDKSGNLIAQTATWYDWGFGENQSGMALQRAAGTNVFRFLNWGEGGANIIFTVDGDPANKLTIDGQQYFRCVMTAQDLKIAYDASNNFTVADVPSSRGGSYATYPCYWDGQYTFNFTLFWYAGTGGWNSFSAGISDVVEFSAVTDPAPAVAIEYVGASTTDTGVQTHTIGFTPNKDAAYYYATVLKSDLEDGFAADAWTTANSILAGAGFAQGSAGWYNYISGLYAEIYEEMVAENLENILPAIRDEIEAGTYAGDTPAVKYTAANKDAWNLGSTAGVFTAVAFSYTKEGDFKGIDYTCFIYNPELDPSMVKYVMDCGADSDPNGYADFSMGYFGDNSVLYQFLANGDVITSVTFALVAADAFATAGLDTASEAEMIAYVAKNGSSLNAAALKKVNDKDPISNGYYNWVSAKAATAYKFISCVSNADATSVKVTDVTTEAAATYDELTIEASLYPLPTQGLYAHNSICVDFWGTHITAGKYYIATAKSLEKSIAVDASGNITLKSGVTDEDIIALIEKSGADFSSGDQDSFLYTLNTEDADGTYTFKGSLTPGTQYVALACANHGAGVERWTGSVVSTDFAPAVNFTQTASVSGKNIAFNWKGGPSSVFAIKKVVYALVPQSALTAAGADLTKLDNLNDFAARLAAATTNEQKDAINADKLNAEKIQTVLTANGKSLMNDAVKPVNTASGFSKQFENNAAGDYALIALASDTYNTKLTVSLVTVQ